MDYSHPWLFFLQHLVTAARTSVYFIMFGNTSRNGLARGLRRLMATQAPSIGETKVAMSLLEKGSYINYQRIEDNLAIVRSRLVFFSPTLYNIQVLSQTHSIKVEPSSDVIRKNSVRSSG